MDPTTPSKIGASARRKAASARKKAREERDTGLSSVSSSSYSNPPDPPSSGNRQYRLERQGGELNEYRNNNNNNNRSNNNYHRPMMSQSQNEGGNNNLLSSLSMALSSNLNNVASTAINMTNAMNNAAIIANNINNSSSSSNNNNNNNNNGNSATSDYYTSITTARPNKPKSKLPPPPSHFSSYLHFHKTSLTILLTFATCYALVLICCWPMISTLNTTTTGSNEIMLEKGASFQHIRGRKTFLHAKHAVSDKLGTLKHRAVEWEEKAKRAVEKEVDKIDTKLGIEIGEKIGRKDAMRASLILEEAIKEFMEEETKQREGEHVDANNNNNYANIQQNQYQHEHGNKHASAMEAWEKENAFLQQQFDKGSPYNEKNTNVHNTKEKLGFVVLGMHRSGTSMLSGLLVQGFGYETGGPLIGAAFDNEKGFYERIDVVLQNDEFFRAQQIGWSYNVYNYDSDRALFDKTKGTVVKFREGERALQFLNGKHDIPYLQKDPRMCIALPTWLELLNRPPAVVFTYRHPLEVAMSLKKREENFTLEHGLRLWIVYNMRAIENSAGLCRVLSSNDAVNKDALREVQRIADELTNKCHVKAPPTTTLSRKVVDEFVDPALQHNHKQREEREKNLAILEDFGNGCVAREIVSDYPVGSSNQKAELELYLMAMSVYCDLESGKAYEDDYEWPDLVNMRRPARIS